MDQNLLNLILALSAGELLHNIIEVQNIRHKVTRLHSYIHNKPFKEMKLNINTRSKSYAISLVGFFVFVVPFYIFFNWLSLSLNTSLHTIIVLLIVAYSVTAVLVDQYHIEIEKVTRPFMHKAKK